MPAADYRTNARADYRRIMTLATGTQYAVLAPVIRGQKGEYKDLFEDLRKQGFVRARVDGRIVSFSDDLSLDRQMRHNIEVVIDRLKSLSFDPRPAGRSCRFGARGRER